MSIQFVEIAFENTDATGTEQVMLDLEDAGIGYTHMCGETGNLVGYIGAELDFDTFKDKAENIVHDHNCGMFCSVEPKEEAEVEHLL